MMAKLLVSVTLLLCSACVCAQDLILRNVHLVDVEKGLVHQQQDVLITDGKITSFKPKKRQLKGLQVIDGKGRYVMPTLFDMHAHIGPQNRNYLDSFLKYGVTGVRVMAGDEHLLSWSDSIARGDLRGPALYVASPLYDGNPPLWGENHDGPVLEDKTRVRELVRKHQQTGYREIKVYNRLPEEVYLEILQAADEAGIKVAGHIPYTLSSEHFGDARHASIEHLDGMIQYATTLTPAWEQGKEEGTRRTLYQQYNKAALAPYAAKIKRNGVWLCPTLSLYGNINREEVKQELEQLAGEEPAGGLLGWWGSMPDQVKENFRLKHEGNRQFIQDHFLDYEDHILIGTDSPNPYNLPGLAVHHEMEQLTEAGFSNAAVLKMATYNAARYLGLLDSQGTVTVGKAANLLLLDENPLEDIKNTKKIHLVLINGQVQNR
ncbi:MAG: amidohydrolase family protein [Hymenobacteraceae bacterium]|nr:amidohydrolase family protein [Hymenobacteraceae bacterium]